MSTTCHIRNVLAALLLIALAVTPLYADVVVLKSGESLSGTFSRVRDNTLIFRTSLRGQMMTPMSEVRSLSADATLFITMTDGQVYYGRLGVGEDGQCVLPLDGGAPIPIAPAAIEETLPIPTPPSPAPADTVRGWDISGGPLLQWRSDSSAPVEPAVRLDVTGGGDTWRFDGGAMVERADPDDFPAYLQTWGEFSRDAAWPHLYLGTRTERDLDRSLELRQQFAVGLYHWLYADKGTTLKGIAALGLEYERWRERDKGRDVVIGGQRESDYDLNLQLGLRYHRLFARSRSISETLAFLPSITDAGEFRARSETAYTMPITDKLHLRLNLIVDYESDPLISGINRWNATIGAGVNVVF